MKPGMPYYDGEFGKLWHLKAGCDLKLMTFT